MFKISFQSIPKITHECKAYIIYVSISLSPFVYQLSSLSTLRDLILEGSDY